ncbi:glycosyltransferase [Flavobacterium qiangtangense]|uniref:Glycosyltransferase n=1 Tax=Flavobacterium qiangtangense TaxID=1442595 RepID=A0ABW1PQ21_9FLAO
MADEFKKTDLEILVSTMNRSNLDFLIPMFPFASFSDFNILIVNQTSEKKNLVSEFSNVKVINSFKKGLSSSRNIALKNATGKILLIADDDVIYFPDFDQKIIDSFHQNKEASVICFQTKTTENKPYSNYKNENLLMNKKQVFWVLSIEIALKSDEIKKKNVVFNEYFGLGAKFEDSESLFFLRRVIHNNLKVLFVPKYIVKHKKYSSSDELNSDRWLYARGANLYKRFQKFSYFFLFKLVFFLLRKKFISFTEIRHKTKVGLKGIQDYKALLKSKSENLYE